MAAQAARREHLGGNIDVGAEWAWLIKSAVGGLIAGIAMAMFAMIVAGIAGDGFWAPPRAITANIFGTERAGSDFAFGPVVVGMMLHMMLSAAFGLGYALLIGAATKRLALGTQFVAGMAWGIVLWAGNTYVIAELLNGRDLFTDATPAWAWFVGHLMFGALLAVIYDRWRRDRTELRAG